MARPRNQLAKVLKEELPRSAGLLLAVSGGIDSMALLYGAASLRERLKLKIEVAHIDHRLRKESTEDAEFVRHHCKTLGIAVHIKECAARAQRENIEAWGRKQRYSFFGKIIEERGLNLVATAHTADDVAETLLMKLISNKEVTSIERFDQKRKLIRPMLKVSREEVERFVIENDLSYREDSSNLDPSFLRNRVRHKIFPLLRRDFDRRISETLSERARAFEEDIDCLYDACAPVIERLARLESGSKPWLRAVRGELKNLHPAVQWRLAERLFRDKLGFNLGRSKSKELVSLLLGEIIGIELPGGTAVKAKDGGILIRD